MSAKKNSLDLQKTLDMKYMLGETSKTCIFALLPFSVCFQGFTAEDLLI